MAKILLKEDNVFIKCFTCFVLILVVEKSNSPEIRGFFLALIQNDANGTEFSNLIFNISLLSNLTIYTVK